MTTSPLRGTPPKNSSVIFKRRVIALVGSIVPPIHCVAGGELSLRFRVAALIMNYALCIMNYELSLAIFVINFMVGVDLSDKL